MTTPAIRPATESDVPAVVGLEAQLFGADAWTEGSVRSELTGQSRQAVVAVAAGSVIGYAVTMLAGEIADLQRIAVHPEHQRSGVAGLLLARVAAAVRAGGADRMLLEVSAANAPALAFYEAQGFTRIDVRRRYYRDGTDALVLSRPLLEVAS